MLRFQDKMLGFYLTLVLTGMAETNRGVNGGLRAGEQEPVEP